MQPGRLRDAAPLLHSASLGALRLQDLPRGLCVYLDPQEAERLGTASPRHWTHKLERLRALETMADVLRQRVDILSTKLHHLEAPPWDLPPSGPEPAPAATAGPGAVASNGGRGVDVQAGPFPDAEMLLWNPCWEPCSLSPGSPFESRSPGRAGAGQPQHPASCLSLQKPEVKKLGQARPGHPGSAWWGPFAVPLVPCSPPHPFSLLPTPGVCTEASTVPAGVDGRPWELQRLQRHAASFQALRTLVGR